MHKGHGDGAILDPGIRFLAVSKDSNCRISFRKHSGSQLLRFGKLFQNCFVTNDIKLTGLPVLAGRRKKSCLENFLQFFFRNRLGSVFANTAAMQHNV